MYMIIWYCTEAFINVVCMFTCCCKGSVKMGGVAVINEISSDLDLVYIVCMHPCLYCTVKDLKNKGGGGGIL
jgi:hypothetical protein